LASTATARAEPDWLSERRRKGASLAQELALPDPKKKGWEFTDLAGLDLDAYEPAAGTVEIEDGGAAEAGALVLPLDLALAERGDELRGRIPALRGDPARYNPEELLVASLSACHMLWFLHLCADAGIVVTEYRDAASGTMSEHDRAEPGMAEDDGGSGEFTRVILRPRVVITDPARIADACARAFAKTTKPTLSPSSTSAGKPTTWRSSVWSCSTLCPSTRSSPGRTRPAPPWCSSGAVSSPG